MSNDLVAICAEVPVSFDAVAERKKKMLSTLSENWKMDIPMTQRIGDEWAQGLESLVLPVPSVVIDGEWNVLVNPSHLDAARIKIVEMKPFRFDERMFKVRGWSGD